MDNNSWAQVRVEPELSPEEVLAMAKAEREKNHRFAENVARANQELAEHRSYSDTELCEMGQEDFVRERREALHEQA